MSLASKLSGFCWRLTYLLVLYCSVGLLFCAYMWTLFYFHVDRNKPRLTGQQSSLRLNPGLSLVPMQRRDQRLIYCKSYDERMTSEYVNAVQAFLIRYMYDKVSRARSYDCRPEQVHSGVVCHFDIDAGGPCNYDNAFGYEDGEICVLLKLNKVYGWVPDPVDAANKGVKLRCAGREKIDDQLLGPVCYYDLRWIREGATEGNELCKNDRDFGLLDAMFFPYLNQRWYENPIVFVQFPKVTRHVLIRVKCWAEAKNILVDLEANEGSITFELLID